jgi:hypothetical protein
MKKNKTSVFQIKQRVVIPAKAVIYISINIFLQNENTVLSCQRKLASRLFLKLLLWVKSLDASFRWHDKAV